jgi:hypothetical protein
MVQLFHKLTARFGRDISGKFVSTMGVDAIREAAIPPTREALDRRTKRQFIQLITASNQHPCKNYADEWDQDPEFGSLGRWLTRSSDWLRVHGQHIELTNHSRCASQIGWMRMRVVCKMIKIPCIYIRMAHSVIH